MKSRGIAHLVGAFLLLSGCGGGGEEASAPENLANNELSHTGDNGALSCGEGTVLEANICVAVPFLDDETNQLSCGEGTTLQNGVCVAVAPEPAPDPESQPVAGPCVDTVPLNDGFGWNGVVSCELEISQVEPDPVPVPDPQPQPEEVPHVAKVSFDGVTAYVFDFSFSQFGRLQVNGWFTSTATRFLDAQCRVKLFNGFTEVGSTFISVDDLFGGQEVPDKGTFLTDGLNENSFDSVRLSGCFARDSSPTPQTAPESGVEYLVKTQFDNVNSYVLGFSISEFGRLEVNGLFSNQSGLTVDAQCLVQLISGRKLVDDTYISVDDIAPGETVPDKSTFLMDGVNEDSFDAVRISGCFTL